MPFPTLPDDTTDPNWADTQPDADHAPIHDEIHGRLEGNLTLPAALEYDAGVTSFTSKQLVDRAYADALSGAAHTIDGHTAAGSDYYGGDVRIDDAGSYITVREGPLLVDSFADVTIGDGDPSNASATTTAIQAAIEKVRTSPLGYSRSAPGNGWGFNGSIGFRGDANYVVNDQAIPTWVSNQGFTQKAGIYLPSNISTFSYGNGNRTRPWPPGLQWAGSDASVDPHAVIGVVTQSGQNTSFHRFIGGISIRCEGDGSENAGAAYGIYYNGATDWGNQTDWSYINSPAWYGIYLGNRVLHGSISCIRFEDPGRAAIYIEGANVTPSGGSFHISRLYVDNHSYMTEGLIVVNLFNRGTGEGTVGYTLSLDRCYVEITDVAGDGTWTEGLNSMIYLIEQSTLGTDRTVFRVNLSDVHTAIGPNCKEHFALIRTSLDVTAGNLDANGFINNNAIAVGGASGGGTGTDRLAASFQNVYTPLGGGNIGKMVANGAKSMLIEDRAHLMLGSYSSRTSATNQADSINHLQGETWMNHLVVPTVDTTPGAADTGSISLYFDGTDFIAKNAAGATANLTTGNWVGP